MFYELPDDHIEFLKNHPSSFIEYLQGNKPTQKQSLFSKFFGMNRTIEYPENWPNNEMENICPEINHRQVKVMHYILNGTSSYVSNIGSLFQTWIKPSYKSPAVVIDGENFAFKTNDTMKLFDLISSLTDEIIYRRFEEYMKTTITEDEKSFLTNAFNEIKRVSESAISRGNGILWSAS
jgi:hypothetical protein